MAAKFELKKSKNDKFVFNLLAANGQVILTSEGYGDEAGCRNGIESVRKYAQDDASFERKTAKDGSPFFNLKAGNGQVIGKSEMYKSEAARDNDAGPQREACVPAPPNGRGHPWPRGRPPRQDRRGAVRPGRREPEPVAALSHLRLRRSARRPGSSPWR